MADETNPTAVNSIELATQLTVAWLNNPSVKTTAEDVPAFLKAIHATIGELTTGADASAVDATEHKPAVPVRSSVKSDFIISLIDGRKLKSLKRHLSMHGLTPKEYRERYSLKPDYPMVAPNYSAQRREVAKKLGLGRKPKSPSIVAEAAAPAPVAPKMKTAAKPKAAKPKAVAPKAKSAPKASAAKAPMPKTEAAPKPAAAPKAKAVAKPKTAPKPKADIVAAVPVKRGRPRKVDAPVS